MKHISKHPPVSPLVVRAAQETLQKMRAEVLAQNRRLREVFADSGSRAAMDEMDPVQVGTALADAMAEADFKDNTLIAIDEALKRIAGGAYGICTDCGRPIGKKRLLAYVLAHRCLECQEIREGGGDRLTGRIVA